jgi:methionine aminotransferase
MFLGNPYFHDPPNWTAMALPESFVSKLPHVGTTIFSVMSALAREYQAINLSQGFPNFPCDPALIERVHHYMQKGYNQYAPMPGMPELRSQLAQKIEAIYGRQVDPDQEITITAGATQALFTVLTAFVRSGDEVVLIEPAYDSYRPAIELQGGKAVAYELEAPDFRIDWEALEQLITDRTRILIVNTPHNPTGTILSKEDQRVLETLAERYDLLVISDEVYEHLVYDGGEHQSVLGSDRLYPRSIATYSFGKTFHATGWKTGYCVGPEDLMQEVRKVHQYNVFSVNTPVQLALADYLTDATVYQGLASFYQQKRDLFRSQLEGTGLRPLASEGTYFQLVDYSEVSDLPDFEFAQWLTKEVGVAAIPISGFYNSGRDEKKVRFCFAKTEETLLEAGKLLRKM